MEIVNENKDLIQEANIIPVINIDAGTPLSEHSDYSINFDHVKTSFKHKIDYYDDKSEKSNLSILDTSHKIFEKLTGSLTALSKTLRNSFESGDTSEPGESVDYDIDIVGTSPGNKFIATWSSENGILAVFPIDSQNGPTRSIFGVKTPFNKKNVFDNNTKIYISVSEDGQYVSITRLTISKENATDTPNMEEAVNIDPNGLDHAPDSSSFVIYSTKNSKKKDGSILNSIEVVGPLIFVHHHKLVCFTRNSMHLISTRSWTLRSSIGIEALIHSSPNFSSVNNEYLLRICENLNQSLKYGYLIWPEEKCGLSIWDLNGILKQWFYVDTKNITRSKNLFAITSKGDLVSRFYEKSKSGALCIFHTPTGLQVSKIDVPKSTFLISFLDKTDQIILCSQQEEGVTVQLFDCWAGLLVFEEKWTYLDHNKPLLLIGDKFLQASGNELLTYSLFPSNSPSVVMEALVRTASGHKAGNNNDFMIITTLEKAQGVQGVSQCWGHIFNSKEDLLCKFMFEPWHNWNNNEIFIHWLDSDGKRFIMAGKDSVQIYKTKFKSNQKYLQIDLQYIWISKDDKIKLITLETREETGLEKSLLHVQLSSNETITLSLPGLDDKVTYRVVSDACAAIQYLRLHFIDDVKYFNRLVIKSQLKKLIESSIQIFPSAFNKISLGNNEYIYPMEDFILLGWDDIVKSIIETNRYIPLFHNEEQTESALLLLVELQKSDLVELMVNYMIQHLKNLPRNNSKNPMNFDEMLKNLVVQQPGFAWTLGKTLLDLYKYYPDKGVYVMRESSYFTTSLEAPIRILQTKLGDPSYKSEERSFFNELKAVTRKARLPKGTSEIEKRRFCGLKNHYIELIKYFKESINSILPTQYDNYERKETGALVYYPEGTYYKQIMKDTPEIRQRRRRQRLEDAKKTHPAKLCVVPWPDFCVYPSLTFKCDESSTLFGKVYRFWNTYVSPAQRSPFADVALNGSSEMFSEVAMEAVIKFKWDKFAQRLFLHQFAVYLFHAFLFCTLVSINSILVPQDSKLPGGMKAPFFVIESILLIGFLIQELRQMSGRWRNYWTSFFNYIDLASFCLPLVCTLMVLTRQEPPPGLKSFAVLCVWFNALLQARAFAGPGKFIAIVIEIGKKIVTLVLTLTIIVFGFANALFVLLRDVSPMDIVQNYNGTITDNNGQTIADVSMFQVPQANTNMWERLDYSILATYFFLGIGWDSVTNLDPNPALYFMMVLFSFIAVIMLLNILIGLITEVFSGSLQVGRQAWLRQRAELIAELELFVLKPSERQHPDWFPHLIYYEAHLDVIKRWKKRLYVDEMGELDASFVRRELKNVKNDLNDEIKELKSMVGQIRSFTTRNPIDGGDVGNMPGRNSTASL